MAIFPYGPPLSFGEPEHPTGPTEYREWSRLFGTRFGHRNIYFNLNLNHGALDAAKSFLGISEEVAIKRVSSSYVFGGMACYSLSEDIHQPASLRDSLDDGRGHFILVSEYLPDKFVSTAVWHELTHASQTENIHSGNLNMFWDSYEAEHRSLFCNRPPWDWYCDISYEREAFENMNHHFDLPLTM